MTKTSVSNLASAVADILQEYGEEVTDEVKESVHNAAKTCKSELKTTSPADTGEYRDGWTVKKAYESRTDIRVQVHNKDHYQLTHLLEDGHANVDGGRTPAKPHIGPAADRAAALLEKDVKLKVGLK